MSKLQSPVDEQKSVEFSTSLGRPKNNLKYLQINLNAIKSFFLKKSTGNEFLKLVAIF